MTSGASAAPAGGPVAKSRMEKRRFIVLLIVQTLMIVHVIQWLIMGTTVAPIEPSESIQTVREGVITVGFVRVFGLKKKAIRRHLRRSGET